ncbi:MAG TPA: NAD+ synthase [Candidatus Omnitrophota bacterium]|nr:NAD+ synthase [Candidatus Omnitrophota bacterium]HQO57398.1 NAD+ synthase [Candidatus Omnitrophota bacterium]HQP11568.1 NAD+ synthase [Candidatus Omnitrophota bacterium]
MIRVALAQINSMVGNLEGNRRKILQFILQARELSADLIVFPELAVCGFPPEDLLFKDHFIQDNLKTLKALSREITGITAVLGFVDRGKKRNIFNAAAVIQDHKICGIYHKQELPNYGVFDEKRYFTPGTGTLSFRLNGVVFGLSICEDVWRHGPLLEAQIKQKLPLIVNLSASPYDYDKLQRREKRLKDCARKTHAYVCYTNLVGGQDELVFDGGSLVINPQGRVLANGKQFEEDLIVLDLPLASSGQKYRAPRGCINLGDKTQTLKCALPPHKEERFSLIERVYRALVLGTRDYVHKNGFKKVVIGLSGGIDSSVVAALAADAVGHENVVGISMPSKYTSEGTQRDARILAQNLRIGFKEIPIDRIFQTYLDELAPEFSGLPFDVAEENLQARIRGNILMKFSNKFGWLVLNAGNKSEVAVGYCTLYGDLAGGFAVIKDISKTQVFQLARFINERQPVIPDSVLERAPSAELRYNQTDQDSLPPYPDLDPLLKGYVEEHLSITQLQKMGLDKSKVREIILKVDRSEYKRRQSPPGIKISTRAFGKDWRLPITNGYREEQGQ